jgi:hypothetical protein
VVNRAALKMKSSLLRPLVERLRALTSQAQQRTTA